ncbi:MAG TPA: NeuD/PglB/VioB family sugar acetyltransferase [Pelolinea sp.]|nr:NeuD/PglB/VioB family sugar acetyltransferase [Pelolinea sp.]
MPNNKNAYPQFPFDATKVIIYGGGGLSKMIIEAVRVQGVYQIVGVIDDNLKKGDEIIGSPVLGGADVLGDLFNQGIRTAVNSVGGIGDYKVRLEVFQKLAKAGFISPVIVHPTAHVDPSARLDAGVLVLAQSYISGNAKIGMGTLINNSVVISHDCILGVCTNFSPGAMIAGDATVGDFTQVGMNATINIGLHVGTECLIGNGATVKKDVPDGTRIYAGQIWPPFQTKKDRIV